jgi:hypothetical protein
VLGYQILGDLSALWIEPAQILLAKTRIPDDAIRIHDHVIMGRGSHVSLAQRGLI